VIGCCLRYTAGGDLVVYFYWNVVLQLQVSPFTLHALIGLDRYF
jgi:hypothetical protein